MKSLLRAALGRKRTAWILGGSLGLSVIVTLTGVSAANPPQLIIESLAGRDSFERYCAPCHGVNGKGNGSVAPALKIAPPDLTRLAQRNAGAFPAQLVRSYVTGSGRPVTAHGTSEMPVWGPIFRYFESDVRVRERIANVVTYIESLQEASSGRDDPGGRLFFTYCASCHGRHARGDGPLASSLRKPPPDLTHLTVRNGGTFPTERVRQIVEGRGIAAHGDREMPVWGDAFQATTDGLRPADVEARIAAIARYLAAIQQRAGEWPSASAR
jgi:mono/diheme cytochrome c family protein